MFFINLFLIGLLIGTAMIIPGVSGGVIAVIFNVYDKMIYALTNLFKNFKRNFLFLFILGLGIIIGAVWFSKIMMFLYTYHELQTKFAFIGLILGGVPYLFNQIKINTNKRVNYIALLISFLLSIALLFISKNVYNIDLDSESNSLIINVFKLFLAGIIYSVGKIVPGISGSFLLIIIGMYEYVLKIISNPFSICLNDVFKLIPFVLGLIVGIVVLLKVMSALLKKRYRLVYSIIIGFVIGSVPTIIPFANNFKDLLFGLIIMFISFMFSYKMLK